MSERVRTDIVDHVAHVQMVRADKMNALDSAMFEALIDAGRQIAGADDIRAVVLSGEGRGFCAGIDLTTLADRGGREKILREIGARDHDGVNMFQHVVMQWRRLPVPVIAAVQDVAFGGGFQLALGPDMRFVAPKARLSLMEIKWGLIPDMAGMALLRDLVRPDLLADLLFSGRIFDGVEAERLGIATRLCEDPLAQALRFAREIAAKSPDAIRAGKRLLSIGDHDLRAHLLNAEAIEQQALLLGSNQVEAIRAGMAGDMPVFRPAGPGPSY